MASSRNLRRFRRPTAALAGMLLLGGAAAACSSNSTSTSTAAGTTGKSADGLACGQYQTSLAASPDNALAALPASVRSYYDGYSNPIVASPYAHFKSKASKPFVIAFNNSFSGNAWRASAQATLEADVAAYAKAGIVNSKLIVTDSNDNNATQIQQMDSEIEQKVSLIIAIPGSPTALNGAIEKAYNAGIPVITVAAPVTTPDAINLDVNEYQIGAKMASGLVGLLHDSGNIMTVEGEPGTPGNAEIRSGGYAVFANCPNIHILDDVEGDWSESVAKTAMLEALSTHPQTVNGVWQQGSMFMGVTSALAQDGRPSAPVTIGNPDQDSLAYWHDHLSSGYDTAGSSNPPGADMNAAFAIGIRTLLGQGPKVNTIVAPALSINKSNLDQWWEPSYTESSTGVGEPPTGTYLPPDVLSQFFNKPASLPALPAPQ
jgi:ribose transport system substrate-binding protein